MAALLEQDSKDRWIFTRGKHEGQQLEDVVEDDPDYIEWLVEEWDGFERMPEDAQKAVREAR